MSSKKRCSEPEARPAAKRRRTSESDDSLESEDVLGREDSPRPASKHTKKERKQNPSSRIHSLRNQLARNTLPSDIQREKERELAALLHEQNKVQKKKEAKKVLGKYHYVRFVERQKAEKKLKQLRKQLNTADEDEIFSIRQQTQEMEVNRNYAIYAPLDQKYVAVFAKQSEKTQDENDVSQNAHPPKPAMWYVVEEAMRQGQSHLEALRDGTTRDGSASTDFPGRPPSKHPNGHDSTPKLGSRSQSQATKQLNSKHISKRIAHSENANGEESAEDGFSDGGFFER